MSAMFRFWYDVQVRFRDIDLFGHTHHTAALIYVEEARAAYWREVAGRADLNDIDYVLGEVRVRYLKRITYPGTVRVGVRTANMGGKSFTMEFEIRSGDEVLASGETTQVMFDRSTGTPIPIDSALRSKLDAYERG
ncbi:MAG TPA: thioesterase family protein [Longimicrobiales bacterium]